MFPSYSGLLCAFSVAAISAGPAAPATAQISFKFEQVPGTGAFSNALGLAQPPGDSRRLFVITQGGSIRLIRDGVGVPGSVAVIPNLISGFESGLLGIAFHPDFQSNGHLYLLFTTNVSPAGTRIMRYTLDPAEPETIDLSTAHRVMTIGRSPMTNHQGGWIGFGPDGYLYISSGDGGSANTAQPVNTLLGKIVRIDVDGDDFPGDPEANYAIPPTNPLLHDPAARPEIWAFGLRNPWRCSFDRMTGDFWIGDVGAASREEVNFQPAAVEPPFEALNYGWPCWEGTVHRPTSCGNAVPPFTDPVYDYPRTLGFSVIGGYVYRGASIPSLRGTYIGGDLSGRIFSFRHDPGQGISEVRHPAATLSSIYGLGEDNAGELYVLTANAGVFKMMPVCWANCDGSTTAPILNVEDFTCFINRFAAGDPYANCDGSTTEPILNIDDFVCFINAYAAGCP